MHLYHLLFIHAGVHLCCCRQNLDPRDLNRAIKQEHFFIPTAKDVLSQLSSIKIFSIIDMKESFWHVKLDDDSSKLCTFNTPFE